MKQNKILITNKKANFDYEISETIEAGLVLNSSEIKSIRENRAKPNRLIRLSDKRRIMATQYAYSAVPICIKSNGPNEK